MSIKIMLTLGLVITCCCVVTIAQRNIPNLVFDDELIETALNDRRFMRSQLKCVLDQGPCNIIGCQLKSWLPMILRGSCPKCTPRMENQLKKVIAFIAERYPKESSQIHTKYASVLQSEEKQR